MYTVIARVVCHPDIAIRASYIPETDLHDQIIRTITVGVDTTYRLPTARINHHNSFTLPSLGDSSHQDHRQDADNQDKAKQHRHMGSCTEPGTQQINPAIETNANARESHAKLCQKPPPKQQHQQPGSIEPLRDLLRLAAYGRKLGYIDAEELEEENKYEQERLAREKPTV